MRAHLRDGAHLVGVEVRPGLVVVLLVERDDVRRVDEVQEGVAAVASERERSGGEESRLAVWSGGGGAGVKEVRVVFKLHY